MKITTTESEIATPQRKACEGLARSAAFDAFGRRHFHPRQWDGFIDRAPGYVGKLNTYALRNIAAALEGKRRKLVKARGR